MFVNMSPSIPFFIPALDFIKQDRLKIVVSCVALAILFTGVVYWVVSHFWENRRLKHDISSLYMSFFKGRSNGQQVNFASEMMPTVASKKSFNKNRGCSTFDEEILYDGSYEVPSETNLGSEGSGEREDVFDDWEDNGIFNADDFNLDLDMDAGDWQMVEMLPIDFDDLEGKLDDGLIKFLRGDISLDDLS